jgi:hypothetical protein
MSTQFAWVVVRGLGLSVLLIVPRWIVAQPVPRPLFAGDPIRIDAASVGLKGVTGYAGVVRRDSLVLFSGSPLRPRSMRRSDITRMEVETRQRAPRKARAMTGALVGYLTGMVAGVISCRGEENCMLGVGVATIFVGMPLGAAVAAIPSSTVWHRVDPVLSSELPDAGRDNQPACCRGDPVPQASVQVPEMTPVNLAFDESVSDTVRRPATLMLRVTHDVVVDGHTVVARGAIAQAPVVRAQRPSTWNHPGSLVVLVTSVATVDGQSLLLGTTTGQKGERKHALFNAFTPWNAGGHAKITRGTLVTAHSSAPLSVRVP